MRTLVTHVSYVFNLQINWLRKLRLREVQGLRTHIPQPLMPVFSALHVASFAHSQTQVLRGLNRRKYGKIGGGGNYHLLTNSYVPGTEYRMVSTQKWSWVIAQISDFEQDTV